MSLALSYVMVLFEILVRMGDISIGIWKKEVYNALVDNDRLKNITMKMGQL